VTTLFRAWGPEHALDRKAYCRPAFCARTRSGDPIFYRQRLRATRPPVSAPPVQPDMALADTWPGRAFEKTVRKMLSPPNFADIPFPNCNCAVLPRLKRWQDEGPPRKTDLQPRMCMADRFRPFEETASGKFLANVCPNHAFVRSFDIPGSRPFFNRCPLLVPLPTVWSSMRRSLRAGTVPSLAVTAPDP